MTLDLGFVLVLTLCCCIPSVYNVHIVDRSEPVDELVFAHILFRHGDRNIIHTYESDPWKDVSNWPGGLGQLTNVGRQQHYELGAYLRKRYFNLMANNGSYDRENIYVRSTDVDRTLMSVSHMLAGMYPPQDNQIWNHSLLWQAIPIHTIAQEDDYVLAMKKPCPLHTKAYAEYQQSNEVLSIIKSNQTLLEYLEKNAGEEVRKICDAKTIYQILWVEELKNFPLPSWTDEVFYKGGDLNKLANFCFKMPTRTRQMARLKAGFLVKEILERFSNKSNGNLSPDRSLWIYSAHDTTIANVLNTLNLFDPPHVPQYASCLFFELHKSDGKFHVEIFYKNYRGDDPVPLKPLSIPNCGKKCPLDKLYEVYKDIIPTKDFEVECHVPDEVKTAENTIKVTSGSSMNKSFHWFLFGLIAVLIIN